ncbi:hypothetical protein SMKI_04G1310 [Saccharomyces mikatae IFO 1815]|uniref:DUF676 domain-containing protein n=1 Tax=Saccharomyces mikatae IFO 1815 TaxID=226126 RepID=A0AA35IX59_SACMI|nr:uncharacterized protein SMKI_04G1310 [Saccharomyces mikatae IFO 1815]CAI4037797.1 hypothetical protein SMKI_04G1310 [Saccharomyces mikatae IFO 1815]
MEGDNKLIYFNKSSIKLGELERYVITYDLYQGDDIPADIRLDSIWVKIKNTTKLSYKAAYLLGPFILYCDVRAKDYENSRKIISSMDKPVFQPNLQAQQNFLTELSLHEIKPRYVWIVDVASQIIFNKETKVNFEISIGSSKASLKKRTRCDDTSSGKVCNTSFIGLSVQRLTTAEIWEVPPAISLSQKSHLVILTHGFQSNVSADMAYMMEEIYKSQMNFPNERLVIKGYMKNICETEKGIKFLGIGLANYIINELYDDSVEKISFIGHSLGGLIQTFAICYIKTKHADFFKKVQPVNFISLASPLLGIATGTPNYVKMSLSMGIIGTTGQELGLKDTTYSDKPLLYMLSDESLINVLFQFKRRTLYINAINDGIVPLYSSSLLFLDYSQLLQKLAGEITSSCDPFFQPPVDPRKAPPNQNNNDSDNNKISTSSWNTFWKSKGNQSNKKSKRLMNTSVIKSMKSVVLPPCPDPEFFLNPDARATTIIHDKIYTEKDLPPPSSTLYEGTTLKGDDKTKKTRKEMEEIIARRWHKGMDWRKVVVSLKPDAHNNIIVRRRFANAYGWPVIDHLVATHFKRDDSDTPQKLNNRSIEEDTRTVTNSVEPNKLFSWLTKIEDPGAYRGGLVSTASHFASSWISKHSSVTD